MKQTSRQNMKEVRNRTAETNIKKTIEIQKKDNRKNIEEPAR